MAVTGVRSIRIEIGAARLRRAGDHGGPLPPRPGRSAPVRLAVPLPHSARGMEAATRRGAGVGLPGDRRLPAVELPRAVARASGTSPAAVTSARSSTSRTRPGSPSSPAPVRTSARSGTAALCPPGSPSRRGCGSATPIRGSWRTSSSGSTRALPIIAQRQADAGGAVIAVQLENELDFFDTADRHGYLTALRDLALAAGITVPLIACAGQGDMTGATGGVDGVVPDIQLLPRRRLVRASNRSSAATPSCSQSGACRCSSPRRTASTGRCVACSSAAPASSPRTCRRRATTSGTRRRSATGATPAGSCPTTTTSTDTCRPPASRGRSTPRRGCSPRSSGPSARHWRGPTVEAAPGAYRTERRRRPRRRASCSTAAGRSSASRTSATQSADAVLPAHGGVPDVTIPLPPKSCLLVTRDLPLERFGLPGTLSLATADLVGADATGIVLAARGASVVAFALAQASGEPAARIGHVLAAGPGVVLAELPAPEPGSPVRTALALGQTEWEVTVWHPDDLPAADGSTRPERRRRRTRSPAVLTAATRLDLPTRDGHTARHDLAADVGVARRPPRSRALRRRRVLDRGARDRRSERHRRSRARRPRPPDDRAVRRHRARPDRRCDASRRDRRDVGSRELRRRPPARAATRLAPRHRPRVERRGARGRQRHVDGRRPGSSGPATRPRCRSSAAGAAPASAFP